MSNSKLFKQIDSTILEFCDVIAKKYKLNKNDIFSLWNDESNDEVASTTSAVSTKKEVVAMELTREKVNTSSKEVLMAFCKSVGIKQSGKKEEIVIRLMEWLDKNEGNTSVASTTSAKPVVSSKKSSSKNTPAPPVLSSITEKVGSVEIRKNKFGNYEHFESGLVFNNESKNAIGRQNNSTGKIDSLTPKDIELCKKFKFKYIIPENLSTDKGLNSVKVEDVDDEEEEELDEEDIEEEEEDLEAEVDLEDD